MKHIRLESVIAVLASVFAHKITYVQLVVLCIYATAVFGYEGLAFTCDSVSGSACGCDHKSDRELDGSCVGYITLKLASRLNEAQL